MIVAFGHKKQQGKDTAAKALIAERSIIRPFASKLYDVARYMTDFDIKVREWYDKYPEDKEQVLSRWGKSPREILLETGKFMRSFLGDGCFIDKDLMQKFQFSEDLLIIPDFRFKSEGEVLKRHNAFCVKVIRPGTSYPSDAADEDLDDWEDWDALLINEGSIEDFQQTTRELIGKAREIYRDRKLIHATSSL